MTHVATLICNPAEPALDDVTLRVARTALAEAALPKWLDAGIAADIPFTPPAAIDQRRIADQVRNALAGRPRERVAVLKGLPESVVEDVIGSRIVLTAGGRELVATMRANGGYTCLVSGGFTQFTSRIAAMIGFDENRANTLLVDGNGRFSGVVAEPILGREAKLNTLNELRERLRITPDQTLAIGDGANDIPMIEAAGLGVAFHAKPAVAEAAAARIDHGDLTALLYAQGYAREEFVTP